MVRVPTLRAMRTYRSKRLAQRLDLESPQPRSKQTANHLPDAWCDYGVAAYKNRSWKRFRKQQFKFE